ncbi:MAG: hypothetical protein BMS9Abin06_0500 [Gammaproteobacteria bacterium]|nr:MAG: hypothetical protein BMS9Abin06_0500 [Gammaproteobacteria bacterium]
MRTRTMWGLFVFLLILIARVDASTVSFNPFITSVSAGQTFFVGATGAFAIAWEVG